MRCPKCQYLGFEPSPRCKNCGYDFSFEIDEAPALTLVADPEDEPSRPELELQIFDDAPRPPAASGGFDLDDLLATGRAGRDPDPSPSSASPASRATSPRPARPSRAKAVAAAVATPPPAEVERLVQASRVPVAPPKPAVVKPRPVEPEPVLAASDAVPQPPANLTIEPVNDLISPPFSSPATPPTGELPLFVRGIADAHAAAETPAAGIRVHDVDPPAGFPLTLEAATEAAQDPDPVDDRPLVNVRAVPRAPLAVRRTTPDPARLRAKYARASGSAAPTPAPDTGDLLSGVDHMDANMPPPRVPPALRLSAEPTPTSLPDAWLRRVSPAKRLSAAALDGVLLASLDAAVVYFTLSVCGLTTSEARLLPVAPVLLFFLLLDGGYLVLFTASCGQTIGKMAAGIRVVGTTTDAVINDRVTVGQAVMRSLGAIAACLPLGAGLWAALVGDGRALHDRIAHTRVISA